MPSFEFIDLILFLGVTQGFFLAITLQLIKNKHLGANRILGIILCVCSIMLLGRVLFVKYFTITLFQWSILVDAVIFAFGPLCILYFRRLIHENADDFRVPWYHFLLLMLHIVFFMYVMSMTSETFVKKVKEQYFAIPFLIIELLGIFSNLYYWSLNTKLIRWYKNLEKHNVSYKQYLTSFLKFFQISIGVFLGLWIISFISDKLFQFSLYPIGYDLVWIGISVFIFVVGYYSLKEPELFRVPIKKNSKSINRLSEEEVFSLENQLKYMMEKEKVFLKPDLTLRDLSEKLKTSTHNISWYLNNIVHHNFYDYVNSYRIQEFLNKIKEEEHIQRTILGLAMDVGFNSKSTFNKAFKLEMNDTPSNYIKSLKVA